MITIDMGRFDEGTLRAIANGMEIPDDIDGLEDHAATFRANVVPRGMGFGPMDFWESLKIEFRAFVCGPTDGEADPYRELRRAIDKHGTKSQLTVVSSIAVFVGARLGVEAGILVPWIAMALGVVRKVGVEAFCRMAKE